MAHANSHSKDKYDDDKLYTYLNADDPVCDDDEKMQVTLSGDLANDISIFATLYNKPHFNEKRKNELALEIALRMTRLVDNYLLNAMKGE